jgi:hypothetical protein
MSVLHFVFPCTGNFLLTRSVRSVLRGGRRGDLNALPNPPSRKRNGILAETKCGEFLATFIRPFHNVIGFLVRIRVMI